MGQAVAAEIQLYMEHKNIQKLYLGGGTHYVQKEGQDFKVYPTHQFKSVHPYRVIEVATIKNNQRIRKFLKNIQNLLEATQDTALPQDLVTSIKNTEYCKSANTVTDMTIKFIKLNDLLTRTRLLKSE